MPGAILMRAQAGDFFAVHTDRIVSFHEPLNNDDGSVKFDLAVILRRADNPEALTVVALELSQSQTIRGLAREWNESIKK